MFLLSHLGAESSGIALDHQLLAQSSFQRSNRVILCIYGIAGPKPYLGIERRDASPCAEQVVFHGLDVSEYLPVGETTTVTLTPERPGTYRFTCQMNMYQGKLIVH